MDKEKILEYVLNYGSDNTSWFGGNFEGGAYLQQVPSEIADFLFDFHDRHIYNYLEIGVASAGFTRLFTEFNNVDNVYLVDLFEHPSIEKAYINNIRNIKTRIKSLISYFGDSHSEEFIKWIEHINPGFDFIMIDGDHTYQGVIQDINLALRLISKDHFDKPAKILFHDFFACPDVQRAVNEFVSSKKIKFHSMYGGKLGLCLAEPVL